jgi:hypothetical protein
MAYVEEVVPKEPFQFPLESILFIVPNNWHPPNQFTMGASASDTDMPVQEKRRLTLA